MKECSILWFGKYHQNWENDLHQHNYFQMVGILNGSGTVSFDDGNVPIAKEKIFLFPPQCLHAVHCDPKASSPLKMIDVKFSVSDPNLFEDLLKVGREFTLNNFNWFSMNFERILKESSAKEKYYYNMINMHLYMVLAGIVREKVLGRFDPEVELEEQPQELVSKFKGINVEQLMQYVNFNYSNIISLDDLSRLANVNKTTLICIFKELYGTTPIQYINRLRMQKAKELLANTDTSIGEIAELIGFQSIHYFSRYFKLKENCTPVEYRIRNTESKYFTF